MIIIYILIIWYIVEKLEIIRKDRIRKRYLAEKQQEKFIIACQKEQERQRKEQERIQSRQERELAAKERELEKHLEKAQSARIKKVELEYKTDYLESEFDYYLTERIDLEKKVAMLQSKVDYYRANNLPYGGIEKELDKLKKKLHAIKARETKARNNLIVNELKLDSIAS